MKDKYYTPTIEELHVGFEYEFKPRLRQGLMSHVHQEFEYVNWWKKETIGREREGIIDILESYSNPFSLSDVLSYHKDKAIRVKYLDREDIESLGFVKWPDDEIYDLGEFQLHTNNYTNPLMIAIYDDNSQYCFVGTIKNKSELKRILKQIGYEQQ